MKKIIFMAFFALVSTFASAQELGVHGLFRTDSGNFGVGVQGRYNFTKEIRGAASFNYYFKSDNVSAWDINANAQYLLNDKVKLNVEPRFQLVSGFNELVLNVGVVYNL